MLGAMIGDIVGSVYEFDNYLAKDFQPFFRPDAFFTDDTICTAAVADCLLNKKEPAAALRAWCQRYFDNGGWGFRFADWIIDESKGPYNSMGNGAAMRVSAAGFLANSIEEAIQLAYKVTEVTHNHPEGMKGAAATAVAIYLALNGVASGKILSVISERFGYDLTMSVDEIRPSYEYSELCQYTVPQALICALEAVSFEDAIRNAISIGGDSDTLAAIAGAVAEARFGIEHNIQQQALSFLPEEIILVLQSLYASTNRMNYITRIYPFLS